MDKRLVIVHNGHSTGADRIQHDVFNQLDLERIPYEVFSTPSPIANENIEAIVEHLKDGDRIISAAGDGTASQLANATLLSQRRDVELGFLPYGNFNDIARTHLEKHGSVLDLLEATTVDVTPLSVVLNGEHWRYAPAYLTIGWTALAAAQFSASESRAAIKRSASGLRLGHSLVQLAGNYFENRHNFIPSHHTSSSPLVRTAVTDLLFINNPRVGSIVRSAEAFYDSDEFGFAAVDVSSMWRNIPFGLKAITGHTPTERFDDLEVTFEQPVSLPVQSEGEYSLVRNVEQLRVHKGLGQVLKVLHAKK